MTSPKTIILAQIFISLAMAFLMTGIFCFIGHGPSVAWLEDWAKAFVTAWPMAFVLSMVVSRYAFKLAFRLTRPRAA